VVKYSINANNAGVSTAFVTLHWMAKHDLVKGFDIKVLW